MERAYRILVTIIIILIIGMGKSYGVKSENLNETITNWESGYFGISKEDMQQTKNEILANLKNEFEYQGDTINNEMQMITSISIEKKEQIWWTYFPGVEAAYEYKLRIRNKYR